MNAPAVVAGRARAMALRDNIAAQESAGRHRCARSQEWAALTLETRMAVLLLAGMEGELLALSRKAWEEFTPPEKMAVQVATRGLFRDLERTWNLRVRGL